MKQHAASLFSRSPRGKLIVAVAVCAASLTARAVDPPDLHDACRRSDLDAVRSALKEGGIDVNAPAGQPRRTPLQLAVQGRPSQREARRAIVAALIEHGADVNAPLDGGDTVFAAAAQPGWDEALLDLLLARGAKTDFRPLHRAAAMGDTKLVSFLLTRGADPNAVDPKLGDTALMSVFCVPASPDRWQNFAAESRRVTAFECMQLLLNFGADMDRKNQRGETALHCAAGANHLQCLRELLSRGARADERTTSGETALHAAATNDRHHDRAVLETLLAASKLPLDVADNAGRTPLHAAVGNACNAAVQSLLLLGADPSLRSGRNQRPDDMDGASLLDRGTREMLRRYTPAPPEPPEPVHPLPPPRRGSVIKV